jgi:hypothetical protein
MNKESKMVCNTELAVGRWESVTVSALKNITILKIMMVKIFS